MAFETILAGFNIATNFASTVGSFAQAVEQKEKARVAEEAAAAAMMEARKRLEVNYYEQLGIQKEPYELARRELLSQGALATEALKEGDARSLAAGVGRVQIAQQLGQEKVATAMQQEQAMLDKLVAGEEARLADIGSQLYLQEAIGAQEAAADAEMAEAQAIQQGFSSLTRLGAQVAAIPGLYGKTPEARAAAAIDRDLKQDLRQQQRGERQELRQGFKEQLSGTPMGERKDLRQQFRGDMRDLRGTQSSVQADNLRNILGYVDIDSLKLSSDAKSILVDPVTKRMRGPEELSENEFKAFTESLSLPVLQGLRKFAGLDVSTRGRNADPSDIGMRQLSSSQISPVDMINYSIPTVTPTLTAPPATMGSVSPVSLTNYQIPNLDVLDMIPQQVSTIPGSPNIMSNQYMQRGYGPVYNTFDPFNLFNIYRR